MTPRSIRRAAERQALKEARKSPSASLPVTAAMEETSSLNPEKAAAVLSAPKIQATKGITGQTVLLPSDDVPAYEALLASFVNEYQPATIPEHQLVQSLLDTRWRLNRISALEFALFARGRQEFAEKFASCEPSLASAMIDAETLVVYAKQLKNLQTQESRLRRNYQNDLAELITLQTKRTATEAEFDSDAEPEVRRGATKSPSNHKSQPVSHGDGFVFSNEQFNACQSPSAHSVSSAA